MSGEFGFPPATAKKAADCILVCKKSLGELQEKMEACIGDARKAWICDFAVTYLGQADKMVQQATLPQKFADSVGTVIIGAIQNYTHTEESNKESLDSISEAFS